MTGFKRCNAIIASFDAKQKWIDGEVNYHEARNLSFEISRIARMERDPIKVRFLKAMVQLAASPHVKYHGLWATDFAVTLTNRMYPGNVDKVRIERGKQIELIRNL